MPIKKIDDNQKYQKGIRLGGTFSKGLPDGTEVDYFVFHPADGMRHITYIINRLFGRYPSRLTGVYLYGDDVDTTFSYWLEQYDDDGLVQRCDGEHRVKTRVDNGNYITKPLSCIMTDVEHPCECHRRGRLHIIIPSVDKSAGEHLRFVVNTGAKTDINFIIAYLTEIRNMYKNLYKRTLQSIPFILERVLGHVMSPDGNGSFTQTSHYFINLSVDSNVIDDVPYGVTAKSPTYMEWLTHQFSIYIPSRTVRDFIETFGMNEQEFLMEYPFLSDVKQMVLDWVIMEQIPIHIPSVLCKRSVRPNQKRKQYSYYLDTGFGDVPVWGRGEFRNAGYDVSDWRVEFKRTTFDEPIPILLGKTKVSKRFKVIQVMGLETE